MTIPAASNGCDGLRAELLRDRGEPGRAAHAVNEAQAEKGERARHAAEEKILQSSFGRTEIGLIECGHDVERQPGQFESDENHEQLLAADEQHQSDRREQNQREILALMAGVTITRARRMTVKKASTRQMTLNSELAARSRACRERDGVLAAA